jgi:hypothetical protein
VGTCCQQVKRQGRECGEYQFNKGLASRPTLGRRPMYAMQQLRCGNRRDPHLFADPKLVRHSPEHLVKHARLTQLANGSFQVDEDRGV